MPGSTVISTGVPLAIYSKVFEGNEYLQNSEPEGREILCIFHEMMAGRKRGSQRRSFRTAAGITGKGKNIQSRNGQRSTAG